MAHRRNDYTDIIKYAKALGYATNGRTRNNHLKLISPNGQPVVVAPSTDPRGIHNTKTLLKRKGARAHA